MHRDGKDDSEISPEARDLALLFLTDLHIGGASIHKLRTKRPFRVRYEIDGHVRDQAFHNHQCGILRQHGSCRNAYERACK